MKKTITIDYLGGLKCQMTHVGSGVSWTSAAPVDNNGDGSSFSPTDMLSASIASCFLTIMGISAQNHNIDIKGTSIDVQKVMFDNPRRVGKVVIRMQMSDNNYSDKDKKILTLAATSCPVSRSVNQDLIIDFQMNW